MNGRVASALLAWARLGVTQPIALPVPADDAHFFALKGPRKIAFRVAQRRLALALSGQRRLLAGRIAPGWKRAVWFHAEAPQIGDALMDLAPRSLLAAQGIALDLVAPPAIASLFGGDRWIGRVMEDGALLDASRYDFAIVDSFAPQAVAAKRRGAPRLPWVSIRGDYLAYDYQRACLATRRLAELLRLELDGANEAMHARQKLQLGTGPAPLRDAPPRVALALGGVRAERIYLRWPVVARGLADAGCTRFALLGSANAANAAREVREAIGAGAEVLDLVAATDLHGTQQAMARCALVIGADGGLLHLACTTTTPLLGLFDASVDPAWRLPPGAESGTLRADVRDVNAIEPDAIVARALALLALRRYPAPEATR